jgi:hypothetical protein
MAHLPVPVGEERRAIAVGALPDDAPSLPDLFAFMSDAELRFETLRLRLEDRTRTARGPELETFELWLRHPGQAKVVTRFGEEGLRANSHVWLTDGASIRTYDARSGTTSLRPHRGRPEGITDPSLPARGRVYAPVTMLPMESLVDTFVHPHGFCQNVLATAAVSLAGTATLLGREAFLLRADHPRRSEVLTDRPDRWLEVGVDRLSGLIVLLIEHIGDVVTREARVTSLELDAPIPDDVFRLYTSSDAIRVY